MPTESPAAPDPELEALRAKVDLHEETITRLLAIVGDVCARAGHSDHRHEIAHIRKRLVLPGSDVTPDEVAQ